MLQHKTEEFDFQTELELRYSKYQSSKFVLDRFIEAGFETVLEKLEIPTEFGIACLAQMAVRKRTKISTLVGVLWKHFKSEENPFQTTADYISLMLKAKLIGYDTERDDIIVEYELDDASAEKDAAVPVSIANGRTTTTYHQQQTDRLQNYQGISAPQR